MDGANIKHFKTAQIAGMEVNSKDLEKINSYALSRLEPEDIFAFKVCMAGNEIDRDYEVFPRNTLVKLANLFVGKTVVKDHDHRSDNQIARIYSTELIEGDLARVTKTGEAFTQLIAKCYMVKTSKNADLIAEIKAGIRKEVSLGCRVDKAVCSICGTDNVKTYCEHFPGKRYNNNQMCYFSLENASDAYELSFVAVPAQSHAGTVKSYGKKPFCKADLEAGGKDLEPSQKNLRTREADSSEADDRLTVNRLVEEAKRLLVDQVRKEFPRLTVNHDENEPSLQNACEKCGCACKTHESGTKAPESEPKCNESATNGANSLAKEPVNDASTAPESAPVENLRTREVAPSEGDNRLTVNHSEGHEERLVVNREGGQAGPEEKTCTQEESSSSADSEARREHDDKALSENLHTRETFSPEDETRLTVNRSDEETGAPSVSEEDSVQAAEALKAKEAAVRIRALDLALSLRKRNR